MRTPTATANVAERATSRVSDTYTSSSTTTTTAPHDSLYQISKDTTRTLFEYARLILCQVQCITHTWWRVARTLLQGSLLVSFLFSILTLVVVAFLYGCLVLALLSAGLLRHSILNHVPGNQLLSVPVNALPLQTEWWRSAPIDDVIQRYLPRIHGDGREMGSGASSASLSSHTSAASSSNPSSCSRVGATHDDVPSGRGTVADGSSSHNAASAASASPGTPFLSTSSPRYDSPSLYSPPYSNLIETHAKDLKLDMLQRYIRSLIATATLYLPSNVQEELFLPDGAVNLHAVLAHGEPLFRSHGAYTAQVQLVFMREPVGRDVGIVLESSVLFANDARVSQSVGALDVLFTTTQTVSVRTGTLAPNNSRNTLWLVRVLHALLRMCFWLPISLYEAMQEYYYHAHRHAPFPALDPTREVGVVVSVYDKFTPPVALQPQLRAINFTCYQVHDEEETSRTSSASRGSRGLRLVRLTLYSSVQLRGLSRFFADRPIVSFLLTTVLLFVVYAVVLAMSCWTLGVYLYVRWWTLWHAPASATSTLDSSSTTVLRDRAVGFDATMLEAVSPTSMTDSMSASASTTTAATMRPRTPVALDRRRSASSVSDAVLPAGSMSSMAYTTEKKEQ